MLFVLVGLMLIASVVVLCLRKSRESMLLLGMCFSLMLQLSGVMIFIAKKGGYTQDILRFLFFSLSLKTKVQYLYITLDAIGYLIAVGRYLFPMFLMEMALHYSMIPLLRRHPHLHLWLLVLPVLSLALSYPAVFRSVIGLWPQAQNLIVSVTYAWVLVYVAVAILLLVIEFFSITMRFCRRQFSAIVGCMIALSGLYLMYCAQDPSQVYRFYSYDYIWNKGLGYLQYAPTIGGYITLVVVNVICGGLCLASILRYTRDSYTDSRDDVVMERKFDVARSGASVFVHSIKNQLLANRVLEKHIYAELDKPAPDLAYIRTCVDQLHGSNELLIDRSEELYRTVKSKSVKLVPVSLETLWSTTRDRLQKKYPDGLFTVDLSPETPVLADVSYLSEALYNLLTNAWEANLEAGRGDRPVLLQSHRERLYTVLEVRDEGPGILKRDMKKIFEPFYSSKNSNYSWGMGLYHVRTIVKAHLGTLRVESQIGRGTSFFILLPRYDHASEKEDGHGDSSADRG